MTKTKKLSSLRVLAAVAFLVMVIINSLANVIPIGGVETDEVSDVFPNLFTFAPVTFWIWGVIYILLAMYTLYQIGIFTKETSHERKELLNKVSTLFMLSSFANTAWIISWHYEIIWMTLIFMATLFIFLMLIALEFKKHSLTMREEVFVRLPFSVYFGWITISLIANIIVFLVSVNWNMFGLSDVFWMVTVLLLGAVIGAGAILSYKDFFYGLVLIWAYTGILINHMSISGFGGEYTAVIVTVIVSIALFIVASSITLFTKKIK